MKLLNLIITNWVYTIINKRVITLLIFISLISLAGEVFSQPEMENYVSEVVLNLNWGDGPDEIGYKEKAFGGLGGTYSPAGVTSFEVDDNENIYILDGVNQYVKIFNNGELINSFHINIDNNNPFISTALDEQGNIWVHEQLSKIYRAYSSDGTLLKSITHNEPVPQGFRVMNEEIIGSFDKITVSDISHKKGVGGEPVYSADIRQYTSQYESKSELQKYSGRNYFRFNPEDPSVPLDHPTIEIREKNGEKNIFVFEDVDPLYDLRYLKEDKEGNLYALFYIPQKDLLIKYNKNREPVLAIHDLDSFKNIGMVHKKIAVDLNGNIFVLHTDETGIQVIKWYKQQ